jgi:hypothetical protein
VSASREEHLSWGRFPRQRAGQVHAMLRLDESLPSEAPLLARGCGRSYGDSCLNEGGTLVDTTRLDRLIAFDRVNGIVRCEAGATVERILDAIVPAGWFLPVTPGTPRHGRRRDRQRRPRQEPPSRRNVRMPRARLRAAAFGR